LKITGLSAFISGSGSTPTSATRHSELPSLTAGFVSKCSAKEPSTGVHRAEVEVDRAIEPDVAVPRLPFAKETGEGEELEAALAVGVALLV
jgi:hypothetical protein